MSILENVFEVSINIWESSIIMFFIFEFIDIKPFKPENIIKYIGGCLMYFSLVTFVNSIISYEGIISLIYVMAVFLFQLVFLKGSIIKKIFSSILFFLCIVLISSTTVGIISYIAGTSVESIYSSFTLIRVVTVLLVQAFLALTYWLIIHFMKKNSGCLNKNEWLVVISVLVISIFIMLVIHIIRLKSQLAAFDQMLLNIVNICVFIMNFGVQYFVYNVNRKNESIKELESRQQQLQYQSIYASNIRQQAFAVNQIRHDMKQHMSVLSVMLSEDRYDEAKKYLQSYQSEVFTTECYIDVQDPYLQALLNVKFTTARQNNIQISFVYQAELAAYSNVAICNLMGNLLDNAIEACQKVDDSREIRLSIIGNEERLIINISNSVNSPVDTSFRTGKADAKKHGFGIKTIQSIVRQYDGDFSAYNKDGLFNIQIILYGV